MIILIENTSENVSIHDSGLISHKNITLDLKEWAIQDKTVD